MDKLLFYEIDSAYIKYLATFEEHLFQNAKINQVHSRKYIGILFKIHNVDYFAPLSSFKDKHRRLSETIDFIKIGDMAELNLNNILPVPQNAYHLFNPNFVTDLQYKNLLINEYRIIKQRTKTILQNAQTVYEKKS